MRPRSDRSGGQRHEAISLAFRYLIARSRSTRSTSSTPKHFAIWKVGSTTARSWPALHFAEHAIEGRDDKHEKAMFAVFQVAVMLKKLKADYYAAWHGETRPT
jgi:hypothetical protein